MTRTYKNQDYHGGCVMGTHQGSEMRTEINGVALSEIDLLRWEVERARVAKALFLKHLGPDGTIALFEKELDESAVVAKKWVEASGGRLAPSITLFDVQGGKAAEFLSWLHERFASRDYELLNGSCPEHFALQPSKEGWMDVTETIGGWGLPIRFYVVPTGLESDGPDPIDPALPHRLIGRIRGLDGVEYGRVMHQFGDTASGFRARLGVYWPAAAPVELVEGHQWHLACEFNLWVKAYLGAKKA
jgi:hypothetical protein